jgi:hypothetical protein
MLSKFRSKQWPLILGIVFILVFFMIDFTYYLAPENKNTSISENQSTLVNTINMSDLENKEIENQSGINTDNYNFSDDPIVNNHIIISLYGDCFIYLRFPFAIASEQFNEEFLINLNVKAQNKILNRAYECLDIHKRNPNLGFSDKMGYLSRWEGKEYNNPNGSTLSNTLSGYEDFNRDFEKGKRLISQLNESDPNLLFHPRIYYALFEFHTYFSSSIVADLLKTQDADYIYLVIEYAQTLYNCNKNQNCKGNHPVIIELCSFDEGLCDVDNYADFINNYLTKGLSLDINIIYSYIENLFENS